MDSMFYFLFFIFNLCFICFNINIFRKMNHFFKKHFQEHRLIFLFLVAILKMSWKSIY